MKKKTVITLVIMAVFVFVAVAVNWKYSLLGNLFPGDETSDPPAVEAGASAEEDTYFDNARYTRSQSREEAIALLNEIINDESVEAEVRNNAYNEVVAYAKITEGEASLENILKAKGFDECIVFLTSDTATVVVGASELTEQQSAQIFDAVLAQTGFVSGSVKVVTYP